MPPYDIRERTFEFGCAIVRFYTYLLQETKTPRRIADRLLGAGTAVGAILEKAEAAHSRADLTAKNSNALKEARETRYWLRLLRACALAPSDGVDPLLVESGEIVSVVTTIRKNAGHRSP